MAGACPSQICPGSDPGGQGIRVADVDSQIFQGEEILGRWAARIRHAGEKRAPLRPRGGGTKDFYGNELAGEVFDTREYAGIVAYEPTELVVTARCGTPLGELEATLAERGQMLAFEPPHYGPGATLGGCVAAGLSGPRRSSAGALRDHVLGAELLDGRGLRLRFGGRVMKNVAGYDVSRALAGSLGTLGVILETSLKVLPRPEHEITLCVEAGQAEAIGLMNRWAGQPLPISANAWVAGRLLVRLAGAAPALRAAQAVLGGEAMDDQDGRSFWQAVREHEHEFFRSDPARRDSTLWRLALPATTPPLGLPGTWLLEWNAGLRWLCCDTDAKIVREEAARVGGHATLFRAARKGNMQEGEMQEGEMQAGAFASLGSVEMRLMQALKSAFDPNGLFSPGRMYPWM